MNPSVRRIALVGCGKAKLGRAAPARKLYTGPLFCAALVAAEAEFGADVWILSAKHGLTDVDEELEPYDMALDDTTDDYRKRWGRDVITNLTDDDDGTPAHLTVYAGAAYADALRPHLPPGWELYEPLRGLGQGERLAWLRARMTALSSPSAPVAAPPFSARPARPATEAPMSAAIPTTLTTKKRMEAFSRALALEAAEKELATLRVRLLAGLDAQAESYRAERERLMRAATTGVHPAAPQQLELLAAPGTPVVAEPHSGGREEPPAELAQPAPGSGGEVPEEPQEEPESPPPAGGGGRKRTSRAAPAAAEGARRAESVASARTAAEGASQARGEVLEEEAVPAPRVPCCECAHSVADHQEERGRCGATVRGRPCECEGFKGMREPLPGAPGGWEYAAAPGFGGRARILFGLGRETLPLEWVPKYGLAFREGEGVLRQEVLHHVVSYLGTSTLVHLKDPRWTWVPLEVLRALAELLGAQWPEARPEPPPAQRAAPVEGAPDALPPELDDPFEVPAADEREVDPLFATMDLTPMAQLLGEPRKGFTRTFEVAVRGNSPRACEACGTREKPRAWISLQYEDRRGGERGAWQGGGGFSVALCAEHCTVEGGRMAEKNRFESHRRKLAAQAEAASEGQVAPPDEAESPAEIGAEVEEQRATPDRPVDVWGQPLPAVDEVRFPGWYVDVTPGVCSTNRQPITQERLHELFLWAALHGPDGAQWKHLEWYPAGEGSRLRMGEQTVPSVVEFPPGLYEALVDYLAARHPLPADLMRPVATGADTKTPPAPAAEGRAAVPAGKAETPAECDGCGGTFTVSQLNPVGNGYYCAGCEAEAAEQDVRSAAPADDGRRWWPLSTGPEVEVTLEVEVTEADTPKARLWVVAGRTKRGPFRLTTRNRLTMDRDTPHAAVMWLCDEKNSAVVTCVELFFESAPHARAALAPSLLEDALVGYQPGRGAAVPGAAPPTTKGDKKRSGGKKAKKPQPTQAPADAPAASAPSPSLEGWRVELPQHNEGHYAVPVWLVNEATRERRAARWWHSVMRLKASHHLAGTLKGAALESHQELLAWWENNRDVVLHCEALCREGRVPGLLMEEGGPFISDPYVYALSTPWRLEVYEANETSRAYARFVRYEGGRADRDSASERFHFEAGTLVPAPETGGPEVPSAVVREASDFAARGFIPELLDDGHA
jgi:hypothetical protein